MAHPRTESIVVTESRKRQRKEELEGKSAKKSKVHVYSRLTVHPRLFKYPDYPNRETMASLGDLNGFSYPNLSTKVFG